MRRSISPPSIIEDPVSILPGITQFLSKQITTLARGALQQPPHPSNAPEIIEAMGFRCDVHKVTTDDGYILTMHRWTDRLPGEVSIFFSGLEKVLVLWSSFSMGCFAPLWTGSLGQETRHLVGAVMIVMSRSNRYVYKPLTRRFHPRRRWL